VTVESTPGEGSTFSVVVPRYYQPPAPPRVPDASPPALPPGAGPVLVIDDDEAGRYLLRAILERAGARVLEAADGERGLELARAAGPAIVFLDLQMPGLSGFEVLERLRADPATRDLPVAVHTARALAPSERERLAGATVLLSKESTSRAAETGEILSALAHARPSTRERP
jgi:CheY-like chemotaxis protein